MLRSGKGFIMKKKMMGLLGTCALSIFISLVGCEDGITNGIWGQCFPTIGKDCPINPPRNPSPSLDLAEPQDMATPDLATPDLATPDLATPDLATPDLATPDLGTTSDLPPSDIAVQVGDMTGAGNPIDLALPKFDLSKCTGNGLNTIYGHANNPSCGADCGRTCDVGNGCNSTNGDNDCMEKHPLYMKKDLVCKRGPGQLADGGSIIGTFCGPPP
jgi:hypothetical protein